MERTLTISTRTLVLGLLVALALVVAYLLGDSGGGTPAAADTTAPAAEAEQPRELTMTGRGEAGAVPDQASFALAVSLKRPDLDDALDAANAAMARVLAKLQEQGVDKADVTTTGLSMDPVYQYHSYDPPTLVGYRVSERASVLVDDLKRAGDTVSAAVAAGGNDVRVSDLRLRVGDTSEVMGKARAAAVEEARTKALQYAEASGQELGDVVTISEVRARPLSSRLPGSLLRSGYGAMYKDLSAASAVPIRAGRDQAAVTVRIVWRLS